LDRIAFLARLLTEPPREDDRRGDDADADDHRDPEERGGEIEDLAGGAAVGAQHTLLLVGVLLGTSAQRERRRDERGCDGGAARHPSKTTEHVPFLCCQGRTMTRSQSAADSTAVTSANCNFCEPRFRRSERS